MENILRLLSIKQTTEPLEDEYEPASTAEADLKEADEAFQKLLPRVIYKSCERADLEEANNTVRTQALWGGYEMGLRMGARLVYELLLAEGGRAV